MSYNVIMVDDYDVSTVAGFKQRAKSLIKTSDYKQAIEYVNLKLSSEVFADVQL